MTGDPNWLYSTIIQSSAAIVAIIGGFITATALSLRAERARLRRLQKDIREEESKKKVGNQAQDQGTKTPPSIIEAIEARLYSEFRAPRFIRWGIVVLAYLAFFGIVLPVIAMGSELFQPLLRKSILVLFCLGIVGLLVYIGWLTRELK